MPQPKKPGDFSPEENAGLRRPDANDPNGTIGIDPRSHQTAADVHAPDEMNSKDKATLRAPEPSNDTNVAPAGSLPHVSMDTQILPNSGTGSARAPAANSNEDLRRFLIEKRLVTPDEWNQAAKAVGSDDDMAVVRKLVEIPSRRFPGENILTEYQEQKILQGNAAEILVKEWIVLRELGQGGMGSIFLVRRDNVPRVRALKMIHERMFDQCEDPRERQSVLARFTTEVQNLAQIDPAHVPDVYEFGEANGKPFYVMECIDGLDLSKLIERTRLAGVDKPLREVLDLFIRIAGAVAKAHQRNIVHRDLTPKNIMTSQDGSVLKILDFGIAKHISPEGESKEIAGATELTQAGQMLGSLHYMSTEQLAGDIGAIGFHTDVYLLAATMFHVLTLELPFRGKSKFEVIQAHAKDQRPQPSQFRSDIPPALDAFFAKALAVKPEDRYRNMDEFKSALIAIRRDLDKKDEDKREEEERIRRQREARLRLAYTLIGFAVLLGASLFAYDRFARQPSSALTTGSTTGSGTGLVANDDDDKGASEKSPDLKDPDELELLAQDVTLGKDEPVRKRAATILSQLSTIAEPDQRSRPAADLVNELLRYLATKPKSISNELLELIKSGSEKMKPDSRLNLDPIDDFVRHSLNNSDLKPALDLAGCSDRIQSAVAKALLSDINAIKPTMLKKTYDAAVTLGSSKSAAGIVEEIKEVAQRSLPGDINSAQNIFKQARDIAIDAKLKSASDIDEQILVLNLVEQAPSTDPQSLLDDLREKKLATLDEHHSALKLDDALRPSLRAVDAVDRLAAAVDIDDLDPRPTPKQREEIAELARLAASMGTADQLKTLPQKQEILKLDDFEQSDKLDARPELDVARLPESLRPRVARLTAKWTSQQAKEAAIAEKWADAYKLFQQAAEQGINLADPAWQPHALAATQRHLVGNLNERWKSADQPEMKKALRSDLAHAREKLVALQAPEDDPTPLLAIDLYAAALDEKLAESKDLRTRAKKTLVDNPDRAMIASSLEALGQSAMTEAKRADLSATQRRALLDIAQDALEGAQHNGAEPDLNPIHFAKGKLLYEQADYKNAKSAFKECRSDDANLPWYRLVTDALLGDFQPTDSSLPANDTPPAELDANLAKGLYHLTKASLTGDLAGTGFADTKIALPLLSAYLRTSQNMPGLRAIYLDHIKTLTRDASKQQDEWIKGNVAFTPHLPFMQSVVEIQDQAIASADPNPASVNDLAIAALTLRGDFAYELAARSMETYEFKGTQTRKRETKNSEAGWYGWYYLFPNKESATAAVTMLDGCQSLADRFPLQETSPQLSAQYNAQRKASQMLGLISNAEENWDRCLAAARWQLRACHDAPARVVNCDRRMVIGAFIRKSAADRPAAKALLNAWNLTSIKGLAGETLAESVAKEFTFYTSAFTVALALAGEAMPDASLDAARKTLEASLIERKTTSSWEALLLKQLFAKKGIKPSDDVAAALEAVLGEKGGFYPPPPPWFRENIRKAIEVWPK
jgi:tRNA A-37 threonylcarbamoyl transferase component Bud32